MTQFELLRSRKFAPLFGTQFLGAFNDNVFKWALVIFITFTLAEQTEGVTIFSDAADATSSGASGDSNHILRGLVETIEY